MKDPTLKLLLALIAVALWAIVLRPLWTPETAKAQADTTRPATYQYWIAVDNDLDKLEKSMNKWGKEGWRAAGVAINPQNGFSQPETLVLMEKRTD
jgi:hypothetical protein